MKYILLVIVGISIYNCQGKQEDSGQISHEEMMEFRKAIMRQKSIRYDWYGEEMDKKNLSIEFEEVLNSEQQLATYFEIIDVFKKSDVPYLLIDMYNYVFELKVGDRDLPKILEISQLDYYDHKCVLIIAIEELRKNKHNLIENENLTDFDLSSVKYFGQGSLLEIKCLSN